jgi:hypothetical protein
MSTGPGAQQEYGKRELVELITGVKCNSCLEWVPAAQDGQVNITSEDMRKVFNAVMSFKQNRIRAYGLDGTSTQYYMRDFNAFEAAWRRDDFQAFKKACEGLLSSIGWD